jgi:TonB family protein
MAYLGPSLRRRKVRERPAARTFAAIALSLLANLVLLTVLAAAGVFDVKAPKDVKPVALAPLSAEQWQRNRALSGEAPRAPAPARPKPPAKAEPQAPLAKAEPQKPPPEERAKGQVVDVAPSADDRKPEGETRFLADRNNRVEKESRSRHAGTKRWENTLPSPSEGDAKAKGAQTPGEEGRAQTARAGREGAPPKPAPAPAPAPARPSGEKLALAPRLEGDAAVRIPGMNAPLRDTPPTPPRQPAPGAGPSGDGDGGERSGGPRIDLRPDAAMLARIAGGPSPDRLDGVEEGDVTALNTRSFRYATYIVRVNKAIYSNWDPNGAYQARDPDFRMYPVRDRTTAFEIVLDATGQLEAVRIVAGSGLDFLDQEILRAVRNAAPFPNPPAGLLQDGRVRLGVFEYTLVNRGAPPFAGRRSYP